MDKRIYRSQENRVFSGVCGGLGEYFNIDPTIIRLLTVFVILSSFMTGLIAYIVCAMVIPQRPYNMPYQAQGVRQQQPPMEQEAPMEQTESKHEEFEPYQIATEDVNPNQPENDKE